MPSLNAPQPPPLDRVAQEERVFMDLLLRLLATPSGAREIFVEEAA